MSITISDIVCLEAVVMYNDNEITRIHMHSVPRSMFDLIPGESIEHRLVGRKFWTKMMTLVGEPGKHAPMTVYCDEAPSPQPFPSQVEWGNGALLRESDPEKLTGENG